MRTRTLSQQILAIAAVGLVTAGVKGIDLPGIFLFGGVTLLAFSFSLLSIDWHYQSAFTAIRDSLALMESRRALVGPWLSHLHVRTQYNDHLASYSPFVALAALGCISIWGGLRGGAIARMSGGVLPWGCLDWLIPTMTFVAILAFFVNRCQKAKARDTQMKDEIRAELGKHGLDLDERNHLCLLKSMAPPPSEAPIPATSSATG